MQYSLLFWAISLCVAGEPQHYPPVALPNAELPGGRQTPFIIFQEQSADPKAEDQPKIEGGETDEQKDDEKKDEEKQEEEQPEEVARLFPNHFLERRYDKWSEWKEKHHFPITVGAWHWGHIDNGGPFPTDYGIPTIQGTYFWYIVGDPVWDLGDDRFIRKIGAHVDFRARENDRFRSFFTELYWFWEAYGYVETPVGKIKAGSIWKRFGLDWDGTFWGNVAYFDGFKLDQDYGVSWENTWKIRDRFTVDTYAQFFIVQDGQNGSIAGADPESQPGSLERTTGACRVVPTWEFCDKSKLALGFSGYTGWVDNTAGIPVGDQAVAAWAIDATYTKKKIKLFGEVLQSYGIINPVHYASEGPSDQITNILVGAHYTWGPATFRFSYSAGWYDNPDAWQDLYVPAVTLALTKNIDFHCEYVRWNVHGSQTPFTEFEDGFQLIINWRY